MHAKGSVVQVVWGCGGERGRERERPMIFMLVGTDAHLLNDGYTMNECILVTVYIHTHTHTRVYILLGMH